ncbi:MAG: HEAT repeat domain-containing protein [Planctomycetes bacterium]|nr:HEAT repeat domain-containing protein [Planctomycetota bacterium]
MKPQVFLVAAVAALIAGAAGMFVAHHHWPAEAPPVPRPQLAQTPVEAEPDPEVARLRAQVNQLQGENRDLRAENGTLRNLPPKPATDSGPTKPAVETPATKPVTQDKPPVETEPGAEAAAKALRDQAINDLQDSNKSGDAAQLLAALAAKGDAEAGKALMAILKGENEDAKENVIEALDDNGIANRDDFAAAIQSLMTDPSAKVRGEVAQALSTLPAEVSGPLLVTMLQDTDPRVIRKALDSLGDLKYEGARADLLPLTRHADEGVAFEASLALHRLGDSSAIEAYVPVYGARTRSADSRQRLEAVKGLRRIKLESTRGYLEPLQEDPDKDVAKEARKAIKDLDSKKK